MALTRPAPKHPNFSRSPLRAFPKRYTPRQSPRDIHTEGPHLSPVAISLARWGLPPRGKSSSRANERTLVPRFFPRARARSPGARNLRRESHPSRLSCFPCAPGFVSLFLGGLRASERERGYFAKCRLNAV